MAPKILVVMTSHNWIESADKATGWFLPELAHPYNVLASKAELIFASPKGGVSPLDPASIEFSKSQNDDASLTFYQTKSAVWENTVPLNQFLGKAAEFDAVFYPGGAGPCFDLFKDPDSAALIREFWNAGKVVSAVCHAPIVFASVPEMVKGKSVTAFTNAEEDQMAMTQHMAYLPEDELSKAGANFVQTEPWGVKVVVDGKLISGQNPASAEGVGQEIAKALGI